MYTLGYSEEELSKYNGTHTAREIAQQPGLCLEVYENIHNNKNNLISFFEEVIPDIDGIILTGAGTSNYIGMVLKSVYNHAFNIPTESISTTHLVSHPQDYFKKDRKFLLVSFARSGNSPESKAAVNMADEYTEKCYHLFITCNQEGELAHLETKSKKMCYILPERANDLSLAMTSSFTGMLTAGLLIAKVNQINSEREKFERIAQHMEQAIHQENESLRNLAKQDFERSVFLGSGPLYGIAKEAQLKMQEMTDGIVVGKHDSFLGLRHGPKAVINDKTLVVFHFSNNEYVNKYEKDLAESFKKDHSLQLQLGISENPVHNKDLSFAITFKNTHTFLEDEYLAIASIVPAQILAFHKAIHLGISPDNPSRNGAISRVVQGVNIYQLK